MKRYDILLAIPRYELYGGNYILPLGILYISAALKRKGYSVMTINLNTCDKGQKPADVLKEAIQNHGITMVGTGGLSGEYQDIYNFFKTVKEISPDIKTICGGGIISASQEIAMMALEYADLGIIGEGEETICSIMTAKTTDDLTKIRGLVFKDPKTQQWINTGHPQEIRDLDALPYPDYEGFDYGHYLQEKWNGYGWNGEKLSPVSIIGSRSCPYACTFCFHPTGSRYRERSLDSIFQEIDFLIQQYGEKINCIALREELFSSNKQRIYDFTERIKNYNLYWTIQLRVNLVDEDIIKILAESGCFAVFLGIESISNQVLKSMNKRITAEQINQVLQWAYEYNLNIRSGIIFGDKAETEETAALSLNWLKTHRNYQATLKRPAIIADMLIPFPGSPIYKYAVKHGIIKDEVNYLKMGCPLVNLTSMSNEQYRNLIRQIQDINGNYYKFWNGESLEELEP